MKVRTVLAVVLFITLSQQAFPKGKQKGAHVDVLDTLIGTVYTVNRNCLVQTGTGYDAPVKSPQGTTFMDRKYRFIFPGEIIPKPRSPHGSYKNLPKGTILELVKAKELHSSIRHTGRTEAFGYFISHNPDQSDMLLISKIDITDSQKPYLMGSHDFQLAAGESVADLESNAQRQWNAARFDKIQGKVRSDRATLKKEGNATTQPDFDLASLVPRPTK